MSSLSLNLFLWMFGIIIASFAAYAFLSISATSREWDRTVHRGAERFSELIQHSTHYSMLLNRKEDVHHIIRAIAEERDVVGVRIYDKNGVIIFSARDDEIGTRVDMQAEACVSCHHLETPLRSVPAASRVRIYTMPDGHRVLGLINPIENAPECYGARCHAHPRTQNVLGVLDVKMSMAEPDAHKASARNHATIGAILIALAAGLFSALFILRLVRRPVRQLIQGTELVSAGDLGTEFRVESRNEMGQLADAFNRMTRDLRHAHDELTNWSTHLEVKLQEKTKELSEQERQVAHMDKMASLGKLSTTVAHELNNPLAGILNYAKLVERTLNESEAIVPEKGELDRYMLLIQKEADRCGSIVRNLLVFARPSGAKFRLHRLEPILDRALMLVSHLLQVSGIRLEKDICEDGLEILCDGDQIQQALVALLVNAVEAMHTGGVLRLVTRALDDSVELAISDTGVGIPADSIPHIFEPFFTSKEGKASGLGLSVAYGILRRHSGRIHVESRVGKGTSFRIVLPRRPVIDEATVPEEAVRG